MTKSNKLSRKEFLKKFSTFVGCFVATSSAPFASSIFANNKGKRKYSFPQGVASGDPTHNSIVLWTRVEENNKTSEPIDLVLQVSQSDDFGEVVVEKRLKAHPQTDHTVRIIVDELRANTTYYYRFIAGDDVSEPLGRTFTAPAPDDDSSAHFAMVSCQHRQLGYMTPYRRMIHEDKQKTEDQIKFILHLGDFIYEEAWYPEETPEGTFLNRTLRDNIRFPDGGKIDTLRFPVTLRDYRYMYKLYLSDPDLQAARARWPFICVWDDHEFSNNSWQSQQGYEGDGTPAQRRKVAANQAWFEFIPAYLTGNTGVLGVEQKAQDFEAVNVENVPIADKGFNENYESLESNNIKAINSLVIYRSLRWGKNFEIILTDNRSFRSPIVPSSDISGELTSRDLIWFYPEEVIQILDAGKTYNNGNPPDVIKTGDIEVPNSNKNKPAGTALGREQKDWFKETLLKSDARWKIWANSYGTMMRRADFHKLPSSQREDWLAGGYGQYGNDDWGGYQTELKELLDFVEKNGIDNFVSLSGDRHNFTGGYMAKSLDPEEFDPVGVEFGVSSITTPTSYEAYEFVTGKYRPKYRHLFVSGEGEYDDLKPMLNMLFMMGVQACLEYTDSKDIEKAKAKENPGLSPQWKFIDTGSHGYATVNLGTDNLEVEFVSMRRPLEPLESQVGPDVIYRIQFDVNSWDAGRQPQINIKKTEGELAFPYQELM